MPITISLYSDSGEDKTSNMPVILLEGKLWLPYLGRGEHYLNGEKLSDIVPTLQADLMAKDMDIVLMAMAIFARINSDMYLHVNVLNA
jgi:hypothetical protein